MPYDPALTTERDEARDLLWDTDDAAPLRPDETYDALIAKYGYSEAVARLAESLASEFARKVSQFGEAGGITVAWKDRVAHYEGLVVRMRSVAASARPALPMLGVGMAGPTRNAPVDPCPDVRGDVSRGGCDPCGVQP